MEPKINEALNRQIKEEFYSSYLYLSMAAYLESLGLRGFAHWMEMQAKEELGHAMKIYKFVVERGGRVKLFDIQQPPVEWESPLQTFEEALKHEQYITSKINGLMSLAREVGDYATEIFLQWFVTEQIEEEASVGEVVEKLKLVKDSPNGLFMIDRELGMRQ